MNMPGVDVDLYFGHIDDADVDWPDDDADDVDPDDDELDESPADVVAILGFDPKDLDIDDFESHEKWDVRLLGLRPDSKNA